MKKASALALLSRPHSIFFSISPTSLLTSVSTSLPVSSRSLLRTIALSIALLLPAPSFGMEEIKAIIEKHNVTAQQAGAAFILSCQRGDLRQATQIVEALLPFVSPEDKVVGLMVASQNNREPIVTFLLAQPDIHPDSSYSGVTPLRQASQNGNLGIVKALAAAKADIEKLDKRDISPLHAASANGHADIVKFLIEQGANKTIISKTNKGSTPLHLACAGGHEAVIELLLPHIAPADIDAVNNAGDTAFVDAILGTKPRCAYLLLAAKADVVTRNKNSFLPLHAAVQKGELTDLVADLLAAEAAAQTVNALNEHGITPLHLAIAHGNLGSALLLLMHKADVTLKAADGKTPLDLADADMKKRITKYIRQPDPILAMQEGAAKDMMERLYGKQEPEEEEEEEEEEQSPAPLTASRVELTPDWTNWAQIERDIMQPTPPALEIVIISQPAEQKEQ